VRPVSPHGQAMNVHYRSFPSVRAPVARTMSMLLGLLLAFAVAGAHAGKSAIASAHPLATRAGEAVLAEGGNAFDAAVAVAAALAVVEPYASGLGGGGFFLLHRAHDGRRVMLDARETAPRASTPSMYLDESGGQKGRLSLDGGMAAGIPGLPAALTLLSERYGKLTLARTLSPAIALAEEGFQADARYIAAAKFREDRLRADAGAAAIFLREGSVPEPGTVIEQPALAATLRALARDGHAGFYAGAVAKRLVAGVRAAGGIWDEQDLAAYQVIEREPVQFGYRGARVTTAGLPSSGGMVMGQALRILETFSLASLPAVERDHLVVEAWRRAYQDRARYLGDADFVAVPGHLGTRDYAVARAATIDAQRATDSAALDALHPALREGDNTTHFSIADAAGNLVAATLSVNLPFGAAVVAGDTGVLLNNEMNDFAIGKDVPNSYRLTGGASNAVAPGKRPLSSMSPSFVEDARGTLVLGTPGGSRILSMVMLGILDYVDQPSPDIDRVVALPRFHHQYQPDRIEYEPGQFSAQWVDGLRTKGHTVQEGRRRWGNMQAVFVDAATGEASAHGDPRGRSGVLF